MSELPICRWRGEPAGADQYPCRSPHLVIVSGKVDADTCQMCAANGFADRPLRDDLPPPPPPPPPSKPRVVTCAYAGPSVRLPDGRPKTVRVQNL